jgi:hypothetical protein
VCSGTGGNRRKHIRNCPAYDVAEIDAAEMTALGKSDS